jgi:hypothetical protein
MAPITFNYAPCSTAGRGKDGDLGAMGGRGSVEGPHEYLFVGPGRLEWFNNCKVLSAPVLWLLVASEA